MVDSEVLVNNLVTRGRVFFMCTSLLGWGGERQVPGGLVKILGGGGGRGGAHPGTGTNWQK